MHICIRRKKQRNNYPLFLFALIEILRAVTKVKVLGAGRIALERFVVRGERLELFRKQPSAMEIQQALIEKIGKARIVALVKVLPFLISPVQVRICTMITTSVDSTFFEQQCI